MTADAKRVIVVTGASRGIGRAIALRFGKARERVVIHYRERHAEAERVADEIAAAGGDTFLCRADVRISSEIDRMMRDVAAAWGAIDVLVNNAGVTKDGLLLSMPENSWDDVIATNLTGPFHCMRACGDIMKRHGRGHIISIASRVGAVGQAGQANYAASKAGLIGLTRAAAKELGRDNIKVNAVLPGYIGTEMTSAASRAVLERAKSENMLGRISDADEVADFVFHLSTMNNVSGQIFNLDSRII